MKAKAFAKINLNLHLLPKKNKAGYYPVRFLNCEVDLFDEIKITKQKRAASLYCARKNMTQNKYCLCSQLIKQLKNLNPKQKFGAKISINKKIPVKAGLGGCSSVSASLLKALNQFWQLNLSQIQLKKICGKLGMDACYSFQSGLCHIAGTGKKIKKLNQRLPRIPLVIITPETKKPSTPWAYQNIRPVYLGKNVTKLRKLVTKIKNKDVKALRHFLHNDFEAFMIKHYPIIKQLKKDLLANGAVQAMLAGAGLSVIGFFSDIIQAKKAFKKLRQKYHQLFLCQTLTS